jgi:NitT/TauT family transport system substrate-binding protein
MMAVTRRIAALAASLLVALGVAACGSSSDSGGGTTGGSSSSSGVENVSMGTVRGSSADAAVFIAIQKGFFKDEGVNIQLEQFNTGAQFIAPLGAGQLDTASGGISAGLFNAVASGVGIKMVAVKSIAGSPSYTSLLVRKDLVDGGRYKDLADLKGMRVAIPSLGIPPHYELSLFLEKAGLSIDDVQIEQIGFADMVPALQNGSVDAAIAIEPSGTLAVSSGGAKKVAGSDEVFPDEQTAALMFSDQFIDKKPETAQKVMNGYLRGVRYYRSALDGSHLTGARGEEVAKILTKYTAIKDPKVFMGVPLHVVDANAALDPAKIQREVDFWKQQGLIKTDVDVSAAIDTSFLDKAVQQVGPEQKGQ